MSRRGSVYRDGHKWRAKIDIGAPGGRRVRRSRVVTIADPADPVSVETARVEAERLLEGLRADYDTVTMDVKSVGQVLALWLDDVRQRHADGEVEYSTWSGYERLVRLHIVPRLGRQPLGSFTPADVLAWQRWLVQAGGSGGDGLNAPMRAKALGALKTGMRWALRMQLVASNPAEPVDPPRTAGEHGRAASLTEVGRLIETASRHRHLYTVLAGLGLRVGEGLGLAWGDVDLDARVALIGYQVQREPDVPGGPRRWVRRLPKGRKKRVVPLPRVVTDALHEQHLVQASQRTQHEALGGTWADGWGLVFTGPDGSPLHASGVSRSLTRTCDELGISRITPHDLRRSCSSLLASRGATTRVRMAILGHSTSRLTEDVYTRAYDPDVRAAMDDLDLVLGRGATDRVPSGSPEGQGSHGRSVDQEL